MEEATRICFERITAQQKRPLFVAITGDSGSGKSYLTRLLRKRFEAKKLSYTVVDHDAFLIARVDREPMKEQFYNEGNFAGRSHWEVLENMFRLDEYRRVINELKSGKSSTFYPYSRETGGITEQPYTLSPADFVLFDTSMCLELMDYVILVDVTQENIIKRKLARDSDVRTPQQIIDMHKRVQGYYWEDRGKPKSPDIIVDNNDFANVMVLGG